MDTSSKQNINRDIVALNNVLDQMKLTDIYRAFHPQNQNKHSLEMHMEHFQK